MREEITRHHRHERVNGGSDEVSNISFVTQKRHESWHYLFGTRHPIDIARYISNVWLDPDWEFICIPRKKNTKQT